jgi:hypothetical protein
VSPEVKDRAQNVSRDFQSINDDKILISGKEFLQIWIDLRPAMK